MGSRARGGAGRLGDEGEGVVARGAGVGGREIEVKGVARAVATITMQPRNDCCVSVKSITRGISPAALVG